ncbi:MAG TPA: amidohydrolase family protein [Thermoanaerobaculia bacterium]|nr:amidohydrolase family protein [Thermoanaerobaculia bacterium]
MSAPRNLWAGLSLLASVASIAGVAGLAGLTAAGPVSAATASSGVVAITGAKVYTLGRAGTLDDATVVVENGRIRAVGKGIAIPAGARTIDARGKVVTPGLFDSLTQIGLVEVNAVAGTRDGTEQNDHITAAFDVADALNPRSILIPVNRIEGLTGAVVAPTPGKSLLAGRGAVIHLGGGPDLLVRSPVAMFAVLGEDGARRAGGSRAGAMLLLRSALDDALDYAAHKAAWERAERRPYSLSHLDLEALVPVARGELPLVVAVERASDVEAALRLAKERRLKLILSGAEEGWMVADQIAAAKVPVLLNPMQDLPSNFEKLGATLENAARLHRAGVTLAFMTGDSHNARNLRQGAGNAVAYGLPWDEALKAMTVNPARIWHLENRLGSLEPGKEADLVIWDGDPLELTTGAVQVFIHGVEMPMKSRQTELRDRYKNLGGPLPPAYDKP